MLLYLFFYFHTFLERLLIFSNLKVTLNDLKARPFVDFSFIIHFEYSQVRSDSMIVEHQILVSLANFKDRLFVLRIEASFYYWVRLFIEGRKF